MTESLTETGLMVMDVPHFASALEGKREFFLHTDQAIVRTLRSDRLIRDMHPTDFIRERYRKQDEEGMAAQVLVCCIAIDR